MATSVLLTDLARSTIDCFCYQYLQLEPHLDYPDGQLLKKEQVQNDIFDRIFADDPESSPRNARFQLRTLKELAKRIQASIDDDEADEYEVSDRLMDRIGQLVSMPRRSDADEAQRKYVVTYRLGLLRSPAMIDILENRSLIAAGGTTGLRTWEAALHLGQFLCANTSLVTGKRILELGAGTGYLSILCAKCLGATHVTASDGSEDVVETLADNFALNNVEWKYNPSSDALVSPKLLKWGHALVGTEESEWNGGQKIDVVIGADITYDEKVIPFLVATLRDLVDLYPDVDIIIAATQRNSATLSVFQDSCHKARLQISEPSFSIEDQHATMANLGQPSGPLTPFYAVHVPIRIFRINSGT